MSSSLSENLTQKRRHNFQINHGSFFNTCIRLEVLSEEIYENYIESLQTDPEKLTDFYMLQILEAFPDDIEDVEGL